MSSLCYPPVLRKYLFTIISYLIGVFIFATIVGQVGNVITNRNANRLEFERLLDGAKTYMRHHKVPGGMKRRVLRWYDYSWSRGRIQGGGDINTALGLLPDKLKTELALHVNLSVLKKVTIFQECQPEFLHDLVLKMKAYIFTPGDLICRKGEVAREMFIIADGILDVISETGRVLTTMKAGDFFGEIGILNLDGLNKRTADVRSVGYSELFSLSREDVLTAMKDYPEAQEILQNLGRKRLMEAKNASKMHKAQAKQSKDHDSSGDSDNAGKRIVEKLRSDVKGLKNALRRSRRGTRTKEGLDGYPESTIGKSHGKKHSILRRMSHVQSSDEFEGTAEPVQSPIGTGVPLLQRLKCLKEKQERDREEKAKLKLTFQMSNANEEEPEIEPIGVGLPLTQRLKLLKQKEDREAAAAAAALAAAGSAVKSEKTLGKGSNDTSKEEETPLSDSKSQKGGSCTSLETRESSETRRVPLIEKLCLGVREKNPPNVKSVQDAEATSSSPVISETQVEIPASCETDNSVPKSQRNKFEVPKSKDGWRLLKKSSITHSRWRRHDKMEVRKVGKRGTYLSKSDTVLEKQKTFDKEEEKRARSTSPPEDLKFGQGSMNEEFNRTDRSPYHIGKENSTLEKVPQTFTDSTSNMRKYDSISDLSPEYSGLPFVKKLKILNERQKLAELEKELIVRSASLDVPERESNTTGGVLTRSQSEASTIEMRSNRDIMSKIRESLLPEKEYSEESMVSPESNETMERRHLKSILKKLSAEGSTSDEDQSFKMESKKRDNAELKKLLRAPTIEGYAARHKKLTKSVTFDRDTLSSPPEPETMASATPLEGAGNGLPPLSPTAILTLQLSNLSLIPIIGSKSPDKRVDVRETMRCKCEAFGSGFSSPQEELNPTPEASQETEKPLHSHTVQHTSGSFGDVQPKSNEDEFFGSVLMDIQQIVRNIMVEAESRFQVRCNNLKVEVRKREDIIHQLLERLRQLEQKNSSDLATAPTTDGARHLDSLPDKSFLLEGSLETVLSVNLFQKKSRNDFAIFPPTTHEETIIRIDNDNDVYGGCEEPSPKATANDWKLRLPFESQCVEDSYGDVENTEDDQFDMKDRISLLPRSNGNPPKRRLRKPFDSDEVPRQAQFEEVKRNRPGRDFFLRRNFSVDDTQSTRKVSSCRRTIGNSVELDSRSRGRFMDRVTDLQRSFSCVQERDFVTLDMDEESTSSDVEQPNNKDWEVQMLVEELEKNEKRLIGWNEDEGHDENERWMSETDEEQMEDVKRLQEEVNTLKKMVCESDLTRLTNSELDMLETIIEAKDQKISQIARSSSLDQDGKSQKQRKSTHITSVQESRVEEQRRKPTLRQKLGQAFSFDFHDIGSRKSKSPDGTSQDIPRKHKAGPCREQQSLTNLWHTSSLLRNRVIEGTVEVVSSQRTANVVSAGSSLPLLMSGSLNLGKQSEVRCSLPSLSGREPNFSECLPPAVNSSEDFNQSCDSVFENSEETASLPTGDTVMCTSSKTQEGEANGSLNNFIKSVGQKVKQVMVCEVTSARSQVPTISKLCDEQSALKETKMGCGSREITSRTSEVIPEEMKPSAGAPEDSFGSPPKTEPPDL
ncbi:hypothetical protein RUM44_013865 [Polyplax serrata]|uniref:Cyclic nucleotide-binding domain-containing protein n=1 Tax=Polyplax serrata TaxID=468196 RepID=A0ABR1BFM7_POLSC